MSRIVNAWRALMGAEPEVIVQEVEVPSAPAWLADVTLYKLGAKGGSYYMLSEGWRERLEVLHLTCQEAFASVPAKDLPYSTVESIPAVRVGNRYFKTELTVGKPKKAKGSK